MNSYLSNLDFAVSFRGLCRFFFPFTVKPEGWDWDIAYSIRLMSKRLSSLCNPTAASVERRSSFPTASQSTISNISDRWLNISVARSPLGDCLSGYWLSSSGWCTWSPSWSPGGSLSRPFWRQPNFTKRPSLITSASTKPARSLATDRSSPTI